MANRELLRKVEDIMRSMRLVNGSQTSISQNAPLDASHDERKFEILALAMRGFSCRRIGQQLGIHHSTVSRTLKSKPIVDLIEQGREMVTGLIPKAINVLEKLLSQDDRMTALQILRGTRVLHEKPNVLINQNQGGIEVGSLYDQIVSVVGIETLTGKYRKKVTEGESRPNDEAEDILEEIEHFDDGR